MRSQLVLLGAALSACATDSRSMVPDARDFAAPAMRCAIGIAKVGGGEDNWLHTGVTTRELEQALLASLDQSGFRCGENAAPRFSLDAFLVEMKRPAGGLTFKVDAIIRYKITSNPDGAVLFDDVLIGSHTARFDDAFIATNRMRLANQGAVRANIAALLSRLNELEAPK